MCASGWHCSSSVWWHNAMSAFAFSSPAVVRQLQHTDLEWVISWKHRGICVELHFVYDWATVGTSLSLIREQCKLMQPSACDDSILNEWQERSLTWWLEVIEYNESFDVEPSKLASTRYILLVLNLEMTIKQTLRYRNMKFSLKIRYHKTTSL